MPGPFRFASLATPPVEISFVGAASRIHAPRRGARNPKVKRQRPNRPPTAEGSAGLVNQNLVVNIEDADFRFFGETDFLSCGSHCLSERFRLAL